MRKLILSLESATTKTTHVVGIQILIVPPSWPFSGVEGHAALPISNLDVVKASASSHSF